LVGGESMTAVHMTWGAINEWTTQAGYARLAQRCDHPVLAEMLRRIMRQEGRHIDFYSAQATRRLAGNRRAQWLTRHALLRFWAPVGSDVMPEAEVRHLISHLFGGADGAEMAAPSIGASTTFRVSAGWAWSARPGCQRSASSATTGANDSTSSAPTIT
jgi:hypothetical protein